MVTTVGTFFRFAVSRFARQQYFFLTYGHHGPMLLLWNDRDSIHIPFYQDFFAGTSEIMEVVAAVDISFCYERA
jgi:hypothetical protein